MKVQAMLKSITILFFLNCLSFCQAQPGLNIYYSEIYPRVEYNGAAVINEIDGYVVQAGVFMNNPTFNLGITLMKVNHSGAIIWQKNYGPDSTGTYACGNSGSFKKVSAGGYILAGILGLQPSFSGNSGGLIMRFDTAGNKLWSLVVGAPKTNLFDCAETPDHAFIVIGESFIADTMGDIYLAKVDSAGNLLWQKNLGGVKEDVGFSISVLPNAALILGGYTASYGTSSNNNFIIKADSSGNIIWQKFFGTPTIDNGYNLWCHIKKYSLGGYLMIGTWDTVRNSNNGRDYIARLDSGGNVKWIRILDTAHIYQVIDNDGKIVVVGRDENPDTLYSGRKGYIAQFDSNGNKLWERLFQYNGTDIANSSRMSVDAPLYDCQITVDGGLILTGSVKFLDTSGLYVYGIWLVKTDSNGCINSDCGLTGINEITNEPTVSLYPNPSNGHFNLSIGQPAKQLDIELLNIQGQRIYVEQLKDVTSLNKEYNLSGLAKGVYLLKVSTENGVVVKRLVVQ